MRQVVEFSNQQAGPEVVVNVGPRTFLVQRHYLALHVLPEHRPPTLQELCNIKCAEIIDDGNMIYQPYLHDAGGHKRIVNVENPFDQVLEHIDPDDGLCRYFHVNKLKKMIADDQKTENPRCELNRMAVESDLVTFFIENRGVNVDYAKTIEPPLLDEPGIMCIFPDGTQLTADGNHRFVGRAYRNLEYMDFWFVPESMWKKTLLAPIYQRI